MFFLSFKIVFQNQNGFLKSKKDIIKIICIFLRTKHFIDIKIILILSNLLNYNLSFKYFMDFI